MRIPALVQAAVATALGALVATFAATPVALASPDLTRAVVVRAVLVLVLLVAVPTVVVRRHVRDTPRGVLVTSALLGLLAGYAITPVAWTGRAFVGQAFADPGPGTAVLDLVGWLVVGGAATVLAARSARAARPVGYTR